MLLGGIDELAKRPVEEVAQPETRLDEVVERVRAATADGAKAYWVCPLVEESESLDVAAAEERYEMLTAAMGRVVGLVHGRMKPAERDAEMARFLSGEIKVLVATTVVEVGVDVGDATIMVIEHAERFGLAQLQLKQPPVALWSLPVTLLLVVLIYAGALLGQRLGNDQMDELTAFLHECLAEAEALREPDDPDSAR